MLGRMLKLSGYSLYFLVALLGFIYLSIPTNRIKSYAEDQASQRLKKKVKIGKLSIRGLSGVTLENVSVELPIAPDPRLGDDGGPVAGAPGGEPTPGSEDGAEAGGPIRMRVEKGILAASKVELDVNTWDLIRGRKLKAVLNAELSGGTLKNVSIDRTDSGWKVAAKKIEGINLTPIKLFRLLFRKNIDAMLSGSMEIDWHGSMRNSTMLLDMALGNLRVGHYAPKDPDGSPLADIFDIDLGDVIFKAHLAHPKSLGLGNLPPTAPHVMLIEKLKASGEDLDLWLDAGRHTITFRGKSYKDAYMDLRLVFYIKPALLDWKGTGYTDMGPKMKGGPNEITETSHALAKAAICVRDPKRLKETQFCADKLKRSRVRSNGRDLFGLHCKGTLRAIKCLNVRPSMRVVPKLGGEGAIAKKTPRPTPASGVRPEPTRRPRPKPTTAAGSPRKAPKRHLKRTTKRPAGKLVEPGRPGGARKAFRKRSGKASRSEDPPGEEPEILGGRTPTIGEPDPEEEGGEDGEHGEDGEDGEDEEDDEADDEEDREDDDDGEEDDEEY